MSMPSPELLVGPLKGIFPAGRKSRRWLRKQYDRDVGRATGRAL